MTCDRAEYGKIYRQLFRNSSREACRDGWRRWQQVWAANLGAIVLHPDNVPAPAQDSSDYWIFATTGPLQFLARVAAAYLPQLPKMWIDFSQTPDAAKLLASTENPRSRARGFVHKGLVEGFVMHPVIGPAMAGAMAWLLSSIEGQPRELADYHLIGYDISHVPGPPGQRDMFNFRAVFNLTPKLTGGMLDTARSLPLPEWRAPPH